MVLLDRKGFISVNVVDFKYAPLLKPAPVANDCISFRHRSTCCLAYVRDAGSRGVSSAVLIFVGVNFTF